MDGVADEGAIMVEQVHTPMTVLEPRSEPIALAIQGPVRCTHIFDHLVVPGREEVDMGWFRGCQCHVILFCISGRALTRSTRVVSVPGSTTYRAGFPALSEEGLVSLDR